MREHRHIAAEIAVSLHSMSAPGGQLVLGLRDAEARHGQQEARIDTGIARLDTFSAEHAGRCPFARRLRTVSRAHTVEHAADDFGGPHIGDAGGVSMLRTTEGNAVRNISSASEE